MIGAGCALRWTLLVSSVGCLFAFYCRNVTLIVVLLVVLNIVVAVVVVVIVVYVRVSKRYYGKTMTTVPLCPLAAALCFYNTLILYPLVLMYLKSRQRPES